MNLEECSTNLYSYTFQNNQALRIFLYLSLVLFPSIQDLLTFQSIYYERPSLYNPYTY